MRTDTAISDFSPSEPFEQLPLLCLRLRQSKIYVSKLGFDSCDRSDPVVDTVISL